MQIEVVEMGNRPLVWSKARQYAPAGAKVLGERLGEMEFADIGLVVIDWSNEMGLQPADAVKPIMLVRVMKRLPEYRTQNLLKVDVDPLDIDDLFGGDTMSAELIADIIHGLQQKVREQVDLRRAM